jgi:hypothetical protein
VWDPSLLAVFIFRLEIPHIGTLRARYRVEHFNVANATISNIDDDGEAHVAYEEGDKNDLANENLQELLKAYGKELFEEILNGIVPVFDYLENRLSGNFNQCLSLSIRT